MVGSNIWLNVLNSKETILKPKIRRSGYSLAWRARSAGDV
jgi:hypothetical protein